MDSKALKKSNKIYYPPLQLEIWMKAASVSVILIIIIISISIIIIVVVIVIIKQI
jgi:hypothetical protein